MPISATGYHGHGTAPYVPAWDIPNIATVKRSATGASGFAIVRARNNPLMSTCEYEVELEDGTTDRYFDNAITENVYSQLDSEGHQALVMIDIVDHQRDCSAVTK